MAAYPIPKPQSKSLVKIDICDLQSSVEVTPALCRALTHALRRTLGGNTGSEGTITLCLADNRLMRELNILYRGTASTTDCLAFDLGTRRRRAFEIIICLQVACANARSFKTSPLYEACLYAVHGLLHLRGWDDSSRQQRGAMQTKAAGILDNIPAITKTLPPPRADQKPKKRG